MDSTITLFWIKTTKNKLQIQVERIVNKIRELSDISIKQIQSGCLISELNGSRFQFDGPKFLWGNFDFDNIDVQSLDDPG